MTTLVEDGYAQPISNLEDIAAHQTEINDRMRQINTEMSKLPMPLSMESWIESLPNLEGKSFKIADFKKMFEYKKEYLELMEEAEINIHKMKMSKIDSVLEKINKILNE